MIFWATSRTKARRWCFGVGVTRGVGVTPRRCWRVIWYCAPPTPVVQAVVGLIVCLGYIAGSDSVVATTFGACPDRTVRSPADAVQRCGVLPGGLLADSAGHRVWHIQGEGEGYTEYQRLLPRRVSIPRTTPSTRFWSLTGMHACTQIRTL